MSSHLWPPWLRLPLSGAAVRQAVQDFGASLSPQAKWQPAPDGNPNICVLEYIDWQGYGCMAIEIVQIESAMCDVEVWRCAGDALVTARLQQSLASYLGAPRTDRRISEKAPAPSPKRGVEPEGCLSLPDEELVLVAWWHVAAGGVLSQRAREVLEPLSLATPWRIRTPARWALGLEGE